MNPLTFIRPGDCLLYAPTGLYGWIIALKAWNDVAHCEAYIGDGLSIASRAGGVRVYPLRTDCLAYVLRPTAPFDLGAAMTWFETVRGQKYDWLGLIRFAWRAKVVPDAKDNRQFCSELLTRWYRAGGLDPFNAQDADARHPAEFKLSNVFTVYPVA